MPLILLRKGLNATGTPLARIPADAAEKVGVERAGGLACDASSRRLRDNISHGRHECGGLWHRLLCEGDWRHQQLRLAFGIAAGRQGRVLKIPLARC